MRRTSTARPSCSWTPWQTRRPIRSGTPYGAWVKHDHPDALVLRFLRARKWDVDKALVMLISTMHWRAKEMHVDDDIMVKGEAAAAEAESGSDPRPSGLGHDFLAQIRMGKSFLHGVDRDGRPICLVACPPAPPGRAGRGEPRAVHRLHYRNGAHAADASRRHGRKCRCSLRSCRTHASPVSPAD